VLIAFSKKTILGCNMADNN